MQDRTQDWTAVDDFLGRLVLDDDPVLQAALDDAAAAGLPQIQVSPLQGRLLFLLARMMAARNILEVGTLGGYSTDLPRHARCPPRRNGSLTPGGRAPPTPRWRAPTWRAPSLADVVDVQTRPPRGDTLRDLEREKRGPFDLVFIDADKAGSADYFQWAIRLGRPGTAIIVDNAIRRGTILDAQDTDPAVVGTRAVLELIASDPRVTATVIQTVGSKGYDGFALALVNDVTASG